MSLPDPDDAYSKDRRQPRFGYGGAANGSLFGQSGSVSRGPFFRLSAATRIVLVILVILNVVGWMVYMGVGGGGGGDGGGGYSWSGAKGFHGSFSASGAVNNDSTRGETLLNIQVVRKKGMGAYGGDTVDLVVDGVAGSLKQSVVEGSGGPAAGSGVVSPGQPANTGSGDYKVYGGTGGSDTTLPRRPSSPEVLPPGLSIADFHVPQSIQDSLLSPIPIEDFATLGDRIRTWVQLHHRLRALDDWELEQYLASSTTTSASSKTTTLIRRSQISTLTKSTLDRFRRFVAVLEHSLFPFVKPTFPSASSLYSSFARAPRSRGIAMTAGNGQVRMALVGIMSIRAAGCDLPIEILYAGDDDLKPESRARLLSMGDGYSVTVRDATQLFDNKIANVRGWAIKPFVIMFASFTEVIFQDSDVVWLGSPDEVFEDPVYKKTGTLFYFDRRTLFGISEEMLKFSISLLPAHFRDPVPSFLTTQNAALAGKSGHQQESGVVAVDKSLPHNFYGLLTTCKMNCEEERDKVVYKKIYGDKETFWMGWELAGQTGLYGWSPHPAAQIGYVVRGDQNAANVVRKKDFSPDPSRGDLRKDIRICSLQLAHLDATGSHPLWFNGGPLRDKFLGAASPVARPTHWAVERGSKWDLYGDNIACLYLKEGANIEVQDDGTVVDIGEVPLEEAKADVAKPFKTKEEGGVGGSEPHRLGPREMKVFDKLREWWEEAGREGLRELEGEDDGGDGGGGESEE
ncbi:hypothetical protein HDU93_006108 [Gonapodya sp. JEL0774]|nr:hypothetical protein HDU93_006108 [Gonapodya sp. JEL0774]